MSFHESEIFCEFTLNFQAIGSSFIDSDKTCQGDLLACMDYKIIVRDDKLTNSVGEGL